MIKIWITGAKGHVGTALCTLLDCKKYELLPTDKDGVNIAKREEVHSFMAMNRPDVIINCAGFTDIKTCETERDMAYRINALGARNLAMEAQNIEAKLIHISTDAVFDLKASHPYNEFDEVHPKNVYGLSKYAGERLICELSFKHIIIRSSWIYGTGNDFLNEVLEAAEQNGTIKAAVNQYASPTSAKELAKVIIQFIENDCFGIYHAVCRGFCSRYEYAKAILKYAGLEDQVELIPVEGERAYSVLDNMMLRLEGLEEPAEWQVALEEYIRKTGGRQ